MRTAKTTPSTLAAAVTLMSVACTSAPEVDASRSSLPTDPTSNATAPVGSTPPRTSIVPAPVASTPPGSNLFSAKVRALDRVDEAVMGHRPETLASLAMPASALERCSPSARSAAETKIDISRDCTIPADATATRLAINVGSHSEVLDDECHLTKFEKSELFYAVNGRSLKLTVDTIASGPEVYVRKLHCRLSDGVPEVPKANCTGKWPLVTQTREFPQCPWSQPGGLP